MLALAACTDSTGPRWVELLRAEPDSVHLIVGESATFTAEVFDQQDRPMPAEWVPRVHWSIPFTSSIIELDTLESGVRVNALEPGQVVVRAELGRGRRDIPIFIRTAELDHVIIEPDSILRPTTFSFAPLTVRLYDAEGRELDPRGYRISWTTLDTTIALVSPGGIPPWQRGVRGVRPGKTQAKVIVNDLTDLSDVYVVDVPLRPTFVEVTPLTDTSLQVEWSRVFEVDRGYRVYRSLTPGEAYVHIASPGELAGPIGQFETTWEDNGLEPGTTYYYVIEACNTRGCSERSPEGSGTTLEAGG